MNLSEIGVQTLLASNGIAVPKNVVQKFFKYIFDKFANFRKKANENSESNEELLSSLHEALEQKNAKESKKRILIVLDDLDRLDSNEVLAMFRLIKTFGNLPNIMFLLVYDNDIVSAIVEKHFPESKGKYLDKFIQFQIDVMPPKRVAIIEQLKNRVLCLIEKTREELDDASLSSHNIVFEGIKLSNEKNGDSIKFDKLNLDDLIASYIKTPRESNLIAMATSCSWIKCNKLICLRDLVALEILKRYEKGHYRSLYDVTDELELKKDYTGLNKDKLQNTLVANSWHKGVTALSGSFENPCLMVLFITGYENYTVALGKMFIQTLKVTSSEYISSELVYFLVKAFILDLKETCYELFNVLYINKYQYVLSVANGISILDYYIDSAMILIKGELKHSEVFDCFLNALIDYLLKKSPASLTENLAIKGNKYDLNAILYESLQSWMGRAVCDNHLLPPSKIYGLKVVLEKAKSTAPLMFIYSLFNGLTKLNPLLEDKEYLHCASLFFKKLKLSISNGDFFNQNHIYVILRYCKDCFLKIIDEFNQYPAVARYKIARAILFDVDVDADADADADVDVDVDVDVDADADVNIDKLKDDIVKELRIQIESNECALNFYLSCANYFNAICNSHYDDNEGNICDSNNLNKLSEELDEFLNFYKLDPELIYQKLITIKKDLIAKNETIIASDIAILIKLINLKHKFSSSDVKEEIQ